MGVPTPFPSSEKPYEAANPAFILFGSRFFVDQTVLELLAELLSVTFSDKWIGSKGPITTPLPSLQELNDWFCHKDQKLCYKPPIKLNLKLFALLCASPLDKRHGVHEEQYKNLMKSFLDRVRSSTESPEKARDWVEDFLMGFQGAGFDRTWCAQTFYPVSTSFLLQETIWNNTVAQTSPISNWNQAILQFKKYYSVSRHRFLARGGELLYLQLCNLFANQKVEVEALADKLGLPEDKGTVEALYKSLLNGLQSLRRDQIPGLDKLAGYIENLDSDTNWATNTDNTRLTCEWCPEESWPEAYLFAVEISRVLYATLDPIERLELLQIGCVLQVMRSLCAQSLRYADFAPPQELGGALGYAWVFSPLVGYTRQQRLASCHNLQILFKLIQRALLNFDLMKVVDRNKRNKKLTSLLQEANNKYGHKYFNTLGKRLGIIYPWKGAEPRFILTDKLLRYLVLSVLGPGESCEYHEFKRSIYLHYGIAIEGKELFDAVAWSGLPANSSIQPEQGSWLTQMLRAGGFLTELSDGYSIIHNPFG